MARQEGGDAKDQLLIRAVAHPLRKEILRILGEGPASPKQLSDLLRERLGNVSYHTKVLLETGCVELVETRPARGAVEHVYKAKPDATLGARSWRQVPRAIRKDIAGASLDTFTTCAIEALKAKTFEQRVGSGLTWFPLTVDEAGWTEILRARATAEKRFRAAAEKSAGRLGNPAEGISVIVALAAFEGGAGKSERGK